MSWSLCQLQSGTNVSVRFQQSSSRGLPKLEGMSVESVCLPGVPSPYLQLQLKCRISFMVKGGSSKGAEDRFGKGIMSFILMVVKETTTSAFEMENT